MALRGTSCSEMPKGMCQLALLCPLLTAPRQEHQERPARPPSGISGTVRFQSANYSSQTFGDMAGISPPLWWGRFSEPADTPFWSGQLVPAKISGNLFDQTILSSKSRLALFKPMFFLKHLTLLVYILLSSILEKLVLSLEHFSLSSHLSKEVPINTTLLHKINKSINQDDPLKVKLGKVKYSDLSSTACV